MSANASSHNFSDVTPMEKCIDHDDDSVIKTENSCLGAISCDDGISAELSGIPFDQSAAVVPKQTDDDIRSPTSQGQMSSDNLSPADQQFGKMGNSGNSFECQQCNNQLGTFEQFIKHMKTAHLQHCDGIVSDSASAKCQCQICGRQLAINRREFNTHLAEHLLDTRTKWHCLRCHGKHFDDANELRQHLVQCHVHTVFRCAICLEIFAEKDVMEDHLMARHCAKQQKFLCAACEISFDSHFAFELHLGQVHAALGDDQSRNRQSKSNNGTSNSSSKGKEDKKEQQPNRSSETMSNGTVPKSAKSVHFAPSTHTTQQKGLKCVVCDLQCLDEFALDQHRLFEHCKVPFGNRCGVCRCPLDSIGTFVDHSLAHRNPTNEEVHCVVCRQLIRGDVQLKMHGQYHLEGTKEAEYGKKRREKDNEEGESGGEGHLCETGEVLLDKDGAGVGDEPPTRDSPLSLSPISALSYSAADNDRNGISSTVPFTMPTMKCPCCQMNLTAEDYGKHLLFHVMVGSLTDFGGAIFGDNGTECAPKEGKMPMGCSRCGRIFDTFVALNSHMLEHLRENIDGGMPKSPTTACKNRSRGRSDTLPTCCPTGQSIECEKCGQKFTSVGRFVAHWRRHKMERTMEKCRICDRRFANKVQLDDHHSAEHSAKLQQMSGK